MGLLVLYLCLLPLQAVGQIGLADIESIRIESGNSYPLPDEDSRSVLTITGRDGLFFVDDKPVPSDKVWVLLQALAEPPQGEASLESLGITQSWLYSNVEGVMRARQEFWSEEWLIEHERLFRQSFTNLETVGKALDHYYRSSWDHDYPFIQVTVETSVGRIVLSSDRQQIFMIPWKVDRDGRRWETKNPALSRAIAELLPAGFENKLRLSGANLATVVGDSVRWVIDTQWDQIVVRHLFGPDLSRLAERYSISDESFGCISTFDVGCDWRSGDKSWNATLHSDQFPPGVSLGVSLQISNEKLVGFETLLEQGNDYIQEILNVPWFSPFARLPLCLKQEYSDEYGTITFVNAGDRCIEITVRFVNGHSLSQKALTMLAEDMSGQGRLNISARLAKEADLALLMEVDENPGGNSRWILFPNGDMLLWHFSGDVVLGWPASDLGSWECEHGTCSATLFNRQGVKIN